MCGICGIVGSVEGADRVAMVRALSHRGPDDEGTFETRAGDVSVWMANRRLAILDLTESGHQPMTSTDDLMTLVYNGEIYNFRELRRELEAQGARFRGTSDTEMVLHAWRAWGPSALERFRGMFALALWDSNAHALFLARDRLGEKPLYYVRQPERLLFASEVRCLLASGLVQRRIDSDGLDAFLTFGSLVDPHSLIQDVRCLETGEWACYRDGELSHQKYWSIAAVPDDQYATPPEAAAERVGHLLRESCALSMESDVPVAVLLSGGMDSSSTVTLLAEAGFDNLETFSVVFEGLDAPWSEERWSTLVAEQFGTVHQRVLVSVADARAWVADAVASMDQPSIDGVNTYLVCRAIASAGIKVALSSQGADELFLGYSTRKLFPLISAAGALGRSALVRSIASGAGRLPRVADTKWEKAVQLLSSGEEASTAAYVAHHSIFSQNGLNRLRGTKRPTQVRFVDDQGGAASLNKLSRLELGHYLRDTLLRDADQMSMAHSLELRQPFLDVRVVERVLGFPPELKVRRGLQKPLLAAAVGPRLPREVVDRPKQGFALPYDRWLRMGLSVADPLAIDTGLDWGAVRQVRDRFEAGASWTRYWALEVLAAWCDRHRIGPPS